MRKVYKNILVKLISSPLSEAGTHFCPVEGQGIPALNIRFSREARKEFSVGSVFVMDLVEATGCYTALTKNLKATYFGRVNEEERIKKFIGAAKANDLALMRELREIKSESAAIYYKVPSHVKIDSLAWDTLNISLDLGKYPFLMGPRGCGKSTVAKALADARGMHYYGFDMGQAIKPKKFFVGGLIIGEGSKTEKVDSLFLRAFTSEEPTLIFLDEITRIPSMAANFLMTVLDRSQSYIYDEDTGITYLKGKGVRFIAAGNMGFQYVSTQQLDAAFEDRFVKIKLNYLTTEQEADLVRTRVTGIAYEDVNTLCKAASLLRQAENKGTLSVGISTRQVLDVAELVSKGLRLKDMIDSVIINNYAQVDEEQVARSVLQAL